MPIANNYSSSGLARIVFVYSYISISYCIRIYNLYRISYSILGPRGLRLARRQGRERPVRARAPNLKGPGAVLAREYLYPTISVSRPFLCPTGRCSDLCQTSAQTALALTLRILGSGRGLISSSSSCTDFFLEFLRGGARRVAGRVAAPGAAAGAHRLQNQRLLVGRRPLVPAGATALFTNECRYCHWPVAITCLCILTYHRRYLAHHAPI
jgi:hypothetical protein